MKHSDGTLKRNINLLFALGPGLIYVSLIYFQALNVLVISLYVGTNRLMRYISKPTYAAGTGAVIDAGIDLNMEGGMGE